MSLFDVLFGSGPGQRLVILGTLALYVYLAVFRPEDARASARRGVSMLTRLLTLIVAALLLASAVQTLVPAESIRSTVGASAGPTGVVLAGLVGGVLPGGPYAVYPIIAGVAATGAGTAAVLAMLVGYGAIGLSRVSYGLVFFSPAVVTLRLAVAAVATVVVGVVLFVVGNALADQSSSSS